MITIDKAVLEQALDALEKLDDYVARIEGNDRRYGRTIAALRKALAQLEAQPNEPAKDIGVEQDERVFARIAAMNAKQAPQKTTPSYIDGYNAGMADANRMAQQEPAGEPVAWARAYLGEIAQTYLEKSRAVAEIERLNLQYPKDKSKRELVALYTRPAVPLTYSQIAALHVWRYFVGLMPEHHIEIARAIEAEHKIGGA
jgi:hypothetical protein